MAKSKKNTELTEGQELEYIGRGFLNFDKADKKMTFIRKDGDFDYWVKYKKIELLVSNYEVKKP